MSSSVRVHSLHSLLQLSRELAVNIVLHPPLARSHPHPSLRNFSTITVSFLSRFSLLGLTSSGLAQGSQPVAG